MCGICLPNVWKSCLFGWSASSLPKWQRYHWGLHTSVMIVKWKSYATRKWHLIRPNWSHLREDKPGVQSKRAFSVQVWSVLTDLFSFFQPPPFSVLCLMLFAAFSFSYNPAETELPALAAGVQSLSLLSCSPLQSRCLCFTCSPLCGAHCFLLFRRSFPLWMASHCAYKEP